MKLKKLRILFLFFLASTLIGGGARAQMSGPAFWKKRSVPVTPPWIRTLGGTGSDSANVAVDASGNVYVVGTYKNSSSNASAVTDFAGNTLSGKTSTDSTDVYVAKLDASGTQLWIKTLGGTGSDTGGSVVVDGDGNVYVAGKYVNSSSNANAVTDFAGNALNGKTSTASEDAYVAKLDASGTQLWIRTLGGTYSSDSAGVFAVDGDGNVYVAGSYYSNSSNAGAVKDFAGNTLSGKGGGSAGNDAYVAKLDASGTQQWIKTLGGTANGDYILGVAVDASGNVYVAGKYINASTNSYGVKDFAGSAFNGKSGSYSTDGYLAKLDASGTQQWIKAFGGTTGAGDDVVSGVAVDGSGNVYVTGYYNDSSSNANAVTDFAGNTLNGKTSAKSVNVFVAKLDTSGTQLWINTLGGSSNSSRVYVDASGNVYVAGTYSNNSANANTVTDFADNTLNGKSSTTLDAYVAKLNASGAQQWIKALGGTDSDYINTIAVDGSGNVYVAGTYKNSSSNANTVTDFAGNTLNGKSSTASNDAFVAKLPP